MQNQPVISSITINQVHIIGRQMMATRITTTIQTEEAEQAVINYAKLLRQNGDSPEMPIGLSTRDGFTAIVYTLTDPR